MSEPFFNEEDFACGVRAVQEAVRGPMRSPALQAFLDGLAERVNRKLEITKEFYEASDHHYACRCGKCLEWWATVGPEDRDEAGRPLYGPFSAEEIEQCRRGKGGDLECQKA